MPQPYVIVPAQGSDQADEWVRLGVDAQLASNSITDPAARNSKLAEAQQRYMQALRLDPRHAIATLNLAIVFAQSSMLNEALLTVERATIFDPKHAVAYTNWAHMALESDQIDIALTAAQKAVDIAPNVQTWFALASILTTAGMPELAVPLYNKILEKEPKHPSASPNVCFVQTLTTATPYDLLKQRKRWYEANRDTCTKTPHKNDKSVDRPLRVGYVSGDFKSHSAAFIFRHVLLNHTAAVEMYLYSTLPVNPDADLRTKQFKDAAGERWRDITALTDEQADALIRKDKIDILVDLSGHTSGGRLTLFTRKPAPIQVTAWGFAHGTGLPEMDYFFADPVAVPAVERQHFAEKIWDLPCIVTMAEPTEYALKGTSQLPYRKNGYITFGAYARYEKMSDKCLNTYAEILRQVPESKLEFKDNAYRRPYSIRRIMRVMKDIEPDRLLFSIGTAHNDHMLAYQQADIILDVFPHSGGVVGLEQIYMGVPIVTYYGSQPAGRSTSSVLTVMGHADWVAKTPEEFVKIAVDLTEDTKQLAKWRQTLRNELLQSAVVVGYPEAVEKAYRGMWEKYVND